jgi:flagellar motor switch protein FliN/FliY
LIRISDFGIPVSIATNPPPPDKPHQRKEPLPRPVLRAPKPPSPTNTELRRILHMQVPVIVKLAERKLTLAEVMRLGPGAIIEFVKSSEEPLELLINNKTIGLGDAVKVGENFGLKINQIGDVKDVIRSLGR